MKHNSDYYKVGIPVEFNYNTHILDFIQYYRIGYPKDVILITCTDFMTSLELRMFYINCLKRYYQKFAHIRESTKEYQENLRCLIEMEANAKDYIFYPTRRKTSPFRGRI